MSVIVEDDEKNILLFCKGNDSIQSIYRDVRSLFIFDNFKVIRSDSVDFEGITTLLTQNAPFWADENYPVLSRGPLWDMNGLESDWLGADNVIYERLHAAAENSAEAKLEEVTLQHLDEFATVGLRTLCFAYCQLNPQFYQKWKENDFEPASTAINDREGHLEAAYAKIEKARVKP